MWKRHTVVSVRRRIALAALISLLANFVHAASAPETLLTAYEQALAEQAPDKLAALLASDVRVRIMLTLDSGKTLGLTLTRDEYLQHQRTLWRFSSSHRHQLSATQFRDNGDNYRVELVQHDSYQLFGEQISQQSRIEMIVVDTGSGPLIRAITSHSHGW